MMKQKLTVILALLFIGFVGLGINDIRQSDVDLQFKEIQLQDKALELKQVRLEKANLNKKFDEALKEKDINEEKVRKLEKEKLRLEEETRRLERDLQAKRVREERERKFATAPQESVAGASTSASITGNKQTWLEASGIPENVWWAVDRIVSGESGWNPLAYNESSGACGLGQQLPCGKWGGDWRDPVHALKSMHQYVQAYGGWAAAVEFRNCTGYCYSARAGATVFKDHTWY